MEETDVVIDIESSTNTNTINETRIPDVANDKDGSILFSSMIYGRPIGGDELLGEGENPVKIVGGVSPNAKKEKRMSMSAKKPPRPPRGSSLDAADQKLIKEISELAMIKRARIERMKALKKMKAAKAVSSASASCSGNFIAMMFTILFCVVILFQGCPSGILPRNGSTIGITTSQESGIHALPGVGSPEVTELVPDSGKKDRGRKDIR